MVRTCCAIGCDGVATHRFPIDPKRRALWEAALNRDGGGYVVKKVLSLCGAHFQPEDFISESFTTGLALTRKFLKKTAVPSIFRRTVASVVKPMTKSVLEMPKHVLEATKNGNSNSQMQVTNNRKKLLTHVTVGTQKDFRFFAIENFRGNPEAVFFYTGLGSYAKFKTLFHSLCPPSDLIQYYPNEVLDFSIPIEDQLFLAIIKLKRNKENYELGLLFGIDALDVQKLFVVWVNFMHRVWSKCIEWPKITLVDFYLKKLYTSPRVIVNVPLDKRNQVSPEKKSTSRCTKISEQNQGNSSSPQNISHNQRVSVQTLLSSKIVANNISSLFTTHRKRNNITVLQDGKQDSNAVHMESVIRLTKSYSILQTSLQHYEISLCKKIYGVCHVLFEKCQSQILEF